MKNRDNKMKIISLIGLCLIVVAQFSYAAEKNLGKWGGAVAKHVEYKPQKVVYDVNLSSLSAMNGVLDRASFLSKITGADPFDGSIVLVLHGPEIPFFARKNYHKYKELVDRAQSLVSGETLKIRMCKLAAEGQGFKPDDIHGFIKIVPMGDAEIIRLQNEENHAYMQ
jgi:intracellular sulfur oxidation DsrE/DsrF family protein